MKRNEWLACCGWAVVFLNILITVLVYALHITDGSQPHAQLYLCIVLYGVSSFIGMLFGAAGYVLLGLIACCRKNVGTIKKVLTPLVTKLELLTSMLRLPCCGRRRYDHEARRTCVQENQNSAA